MSAEPTTFELFEDKYHNFVNFIKNEVPKEFHQHFGALTSLPASVSLGVFTTTISAWIDKDKEKVDQFEAEMDKLIKVMESEVKEEIEQKTSVWFKDFLVEVEKVILAVTITELQQKQKSLFESVKVHLEKNPKEGEQVVVKLLRYLHLFVGILKDHKKGLLLPN
jgi:hypothetical protein